MTHCRLAAGKIRGWDVNWDGWGLIPFAVPRWSFWITNRSGRIGGIPILTIGSLMQAGARFPEIKGQQVQMIQITVGGAKVTAKSLGIWDRIADLA